MLAIISVACLLCLTAASPNANLYIQNVLSSPYPTDVRNLRLEPAILKNFGVYIGRPGVPATGTANFTNGQMAGLSLARRYSECAGPKLVKGLQTVNCTISLSSFKTSFNGQIKNGTSQIYNIRGTANLTDTLVYVVIGAQTPYYYGSVRSFQIQRIAGIVPKFVGLPPAFQQFTSQLANAYTSNVYPQLLDIVNQSFIYALNSALSRTPMPRS